MVVVVFGPSLIWDSSISILPTLWNTPDERQITRLICACLKYDLYDFCRGVFGPASCSFSLV